MANKPDFNELSKKLNLGGLVQNVKSLIMPGASTPNPEEGDRAGRYLAEMSLLLQEMAAVHAEQAKRMAKLNGLFNETFNFLKAEREGLEEAVKQAEAKESVEEEEEGDTQKPPVSPKKKGEKKEAK